MIWVTLIALFAFIVAYSYAEHVYHQDDYEETQRRRELMREVRRQK